MYSAEGINLSNNKIWESAIDIIKENTTDVSYNTWFTPLSLRRIDNELNIVYIESSDDVVIKFLKDRYLHLIEDTFEKVTGKTYKIIIKTREEYENEGKRPAKPKKVSDNSKLFNPRLCFENFVVGNSNKYAHAAALAVAESPAEAYNPLFIYGGSGLGKTHLMQAIGIYIIRNNPDTNVLYVSSEMFTNELIKAISENKTRAFKNKYRKVDVLLIDDIQFLEGKDTTQEEFFYTFNALYGDNKQIVISSDRPPNSLVNLEERLRSRFSWNLIADLQPADYETRVAILKKKAENAEIEWTQDVYDVCCLIAEQVTDNIRELEGAFNRIVGFSNLLGEEINIPFARRILKDIIQDNDKAVAPERIRSIVARHYKIKVSDMDSKKRNAEITLPRQVAMYLCRENTDLSLPKIGKLFGGRHYSTVIHSHDKIRELYETDEQVRKDIDEINAKLNEQHR